METQNSDLPWIEKYRPSTVDEILSHTEIISTITKLADSHQLPHLLLYGPAGTGKTSTVMAMARRIYKEQLRSNVLELNASDERGIEVVRNQIKDFSSTKQLFGKRDSFKLVILDEADQMTHEAQAALRRVIELYTQNVRFCIICNYVDKIIPAIQSRCTRFRFGPLNKKMVVGRLREIAINEKTAFTDEALSAVYKLSGGDMRKGLNILQASAMASLSDEITDEHVYSATGSPSPLTMRTFIDLTVNSGLKEALSSSKSLITERGLALADVVRELQPWLTKMDLPQSVKCWAIEKLSDVEHQLAFSCNDKLQLHGIVSIMQLVRVSITEDKPIKSLVVKDVMD
eukprot:TRINITY_DN7341_c0_g1_i1.p1 TRINITY_DN7341_c0_g1~~TRINITY_DN7341_c0_g1_i1.p1  ORF type:complete len:360 (+),score=69.59 TRINITY_DN7341_c0_g1_i1:51-1082(+)